MESLFQEPNEAARDPSHFKYFKRTKTQKYQHNVFHVEKISWGCLPRIRGALFWVQDLNQLCVVRHIRECRTAGPPLADSEVHQARNHTMADTASSPILLVSITNWSEKRLSFHSGTLTRKSLIHSCCCDSWSGRFRAAIYFFSESNSKGF